MSSLILREIWIYPVKSLGGIRVPSARVLDKGLEFDRRYMLVDENNVFMTQRSTPLMALFKLTRENGSFKITYKTDTITLPEHPEELTDYVDAKIWQDEVSVSELGAAYNEWFSERLGVKCKLVFFKEQNPRLVDQDFAKDNEHVSLADGYPFLIIGCSSLNDLNAKLKVPVPMNRFRPNFVFEGGRPYDEDSWRNFSIGQNRFVGVKPCARCTLITVDQDSATKGQEPLSTLSTFRRREGKVYFGQNLLAVDHFEVKENDLIKVESYQ